MVECLYKFIGIFNSIDEAKVKCIEIINDEPSLLFVVDNKSYIYDINGDITEVPKIEKINLTKQMGLINDIILKTMVTIAGTKDLNTEVKFIDFIPEALDEIIESMERYIDYLDTIDYKIDYIDKEYNGILLTGVPQFVFNIK